MFYRRESGPKEEIRAMARTYDVTDKDPDGTEKCDQAYRQVDVEARNLK